MKAEPVDLGFGTEAKQREKDLALLRALLNKPEELTSEQHDAFGRMLLFIGNSGRFLSEKQRAWAEGIAEKLEVDWEDPAEKNAKVPKGRHVEPAPVLKNLPKSPPIRKRIGESECDCMDCSISGEPTH